MATNASLGFGILFQSGNGAIPEIFTTLAEVKNVTPPAMSRDAPEVTHEQSPNGWREFIGGLKDGGEISLEMNFIPNGSGAAAMMAEWSLLNGSAAKNRRIQFPDGSYFSCAAILTAFEPDGPIDEAMTASATFKVSGEPVLVQS